MKKLLFLTIFANLIALGSDQDQVMFSNKDTAQLLANFFKLPNELKQQIIPDYCSDLNSLVYLKPIPKNNSCYWTDLLDNPKIKLLRNGCVYSYVHKDKEYPLYINGVYYRGCQPYIPCRHHIGPNKSNIILLENYLFDLNKASQYEPSAIEKFKCLFGEYQMVKPSQKSRILWGRFNDFKDSEDKISNEAVFIDDKYVFNQCTFCLHPTKNIFVSKDSGFYYPFVRGAQNLGPKKTKLNSHPRINITHYDTKTEKFSVASIDVANEIISCVFDNSELSRETLWGIDNTHNLLRFTKTNSNTYESEQFKLSHNVVSLHQLRSNPKLVLLNSDSSSYLYQIQDDRTLKLIKTFNAPATFLQKDDNLSARTKYQQEHVVIIKPLTAVTEFIQKQSAKALVDKMPKLLAAKANLKQRILQSFQPGKDIK